MNLTTGRIAELAAAVVLLGGAIFVYQRPRGSDPKSDSYGSQGAVIMLVVAAIMGAHALGLFNYHPSKAEAEYLKDHAR